MMSNREDSPGLRERLARYSASGALPMHMPGHKRNLTAAPFLAPLGGGLDITEIDGFDDLHHAAGVLKDEMDRAAALWGVRRTFFLVNGSTCGLLAAIYALGAGGGTAVAARSCHRAVYHGLELCGLRPRWLRPEWCGELGIWGSVSPGEVERALDEAPDARFVLLTSPTYEGVLSDISAIAAVCHARGVPLVVDEAHGAHLGFGGFPPGAVKLGADVAVQSAHKTLPSLTQTALLHLNGTLVEESAVERALGIFETSSPSYLLLSSLSGCVRFLEKPDCFEAWRAGLAAFDRAASGLEHLRIPNYGAMRGKTWPGVFGWDESKLVMFHFACGEESPHRFADLPPFTRGAYAGGYWLMDELRRGYGIELEMAQPHYAVAMTGAGDDEASLTRLARALLELDGETGGGFAAIPGPPGPFPPAGTGLREALTAPFEAVPLEKAAGRLIAQYLWAYPPGVPLAAPGEELTAELLDRLDELVRGGAQLRSSPRGDAGMVRVVKK